MKINFCEVIIKVKIFIRHKYIIVDFFFIMISSSKRNKLLLLLLYFLLLFVVVAVDFIDFFLLIYILRLLLLLYYSCCCCLFLLVDFDFFYYLLGFWLGVCWSYNFWIFPAPNFQNPCCSHWLFKAFSHFSSWSRFVFRHIRRRRRRRRFGVGDICGIILGQKSNFGDIFRGNKGGKKLRSQKRFAPRRD